MFKAGAIRTGIDLGTESVKLVCARGRKQLESITHIGSQAWDEEGSGTVVDRAAGALNQILSRLDLNRRRVGRVAVAVRGAGSHACEAVMPTLGQQDFERALPYESRKHLNLEHMTEPVVAAQIIAPVEAPEGETASQMRVMLAAAPRAQRDFPVQVLNRVGLDPVVVDFEPLAAINELVGGVLVPEGMRGAVGLLDLGAHHGLLHITSLDGGFVSRRVGVGRPGVNDALDQEYVTNLVQNVRETLTYYRGRHHVHVQQIFVCGGGALLPGLRQSLQDTLGLEVMIHDPLKRLASKARGFDELGSKAPRFVTACGLCRWGDTPHV